jgi:hypothetical protein
MLSPYTLMIPFPGLVQDSFLNFIIYVSLSIPAAQGMDE